MDFLFKPLTKYRKRIKPPSMFFWLLFSFLSIILLLFLFILYSVFFFRGQVKDEVISYNRVNLSNTTESYESRFRIIQNAILTFSMTDNVGELDKSAFDYVTGVRLMEDIQKFLANESLFLDNLLVYFEKSGIVVEKSRGSDANVMFNRFYINEGYPFAYWQTQFEKRYVWRLLPGTQFFEQDYQDKKVGGKPVIPMIVKNHNHPSVYFIALIDSQKMYENFHQSINDSFYILNDTQPFFTASGEPEAQFPDFADPYGHVVKDNKYYFYQKGSMTGLTFVNVIPVDNIASQMKWNVSFVVLFAMSVLISVLVSLLLSYRLNRPIQRLVSAIQQVTTRFPWQKHSSIKEFNIIYEKIGHLLDANWDISRNLHERNSLLRHYAYINKLKNIRNDTGFLQELIETKAPYRFALFRITFRLPWLEEDGDEERATSFIRELIDKIVSGSFPESVTLQLESDQILSILYTEHGDQPLAGTLEEIRKVLELDRAYCFLTIAVSGRHEGPETFSASFEQTRKLLKHRLYDDHTQILNEGVEEPAPIYLLPAQEEEMNVRMQFGTDTQVIPYIKRELAALSRKNATEEQVRLFLDNLLERARRELLIHELDTSLLQTFHTRLQHAHTYGELDLLVEEWLPRIAELIQGKKEKKDPITSFIFEYLEQHYSQDITLEMMADKLNISRSYLSTYFKSKTGTYFVDYVNLFRINRAKELLAGSDVKIQDAAAKVGYQNINSFNRMFKKFTGVTPSEFRRLERV